MGAWERCGARGGVWECVLPNNDCRKTIQFIYKSTKKEEEQIDETYELESELVDLIKADKNKQRWDECFAFKARKDKWYKKVQEEFEHFSCYELPHEPLTLPCAHT